MVYSPTMLDLQKI